MVEFHLVVLAIVTAFAFRMLTVVFTIAMLLGITASFMPFAMFVFAIAGDWGELSTIAVSRKVGIQYFIAGSFLVYSLGYNQTFALT